MAKSYIVGTGGFAREVLFLMDELGMYNTLHGFIEPDHILSLIHIYCDSWKYIYI